MFTCVGARVRAATHSYAICSSIHLAVILRTDWITEPNSKRGCLASTLALSPTIANKEAGGRGGKASRSGV